MDILIIVLIIACIVLFIIGLATYEDGFFYAALLFFIAICFALAGGSAMQNDMRKEAIKTGNAYYKQIVDEDGNVKNEFHWAKEPETKTDCKCTECQKKHQINLLTNSK